MDIILNKEPICITWYKIEQTTIPPKQTNKDSTSCPIRFEPYKIMPYYTEIP